MMMRAQWHGGHQGHCAGEGVFFFLLHCKSCSAIYERKVLLLINVGGKASWCFMQMANETFLEYPHQCSWNKAHKENNT